MGREGVKERDPSSGPGPQAASPEPKYVGRFAPSPSGPLHFGSLVAAVGSYLQARSNSGAWRLRIEDLDTPRVVPGASDDIIRTLSLFGFEWQGPIEFQSRRLDYYRDALATLLHRNLVYSCTCTRAQIAAIDEQRYPGTCRRTNYRLDEPAAMRFRVEPGVIELTDRVQGLFALDVADHSGDFVVRRRDGIFAYHLAVVVDDAEHGITEIVRGADLLDSTPRHLLLQRALSLNTPIYCHLPLALDSEGRKLSKSLQSLPVDPLNPVPSLWESLRFLNQSPPLQLRTAALNDLWQWAHNHWQLNFLPLVKSDRAPGL